MKNLALLTITVVALVGLFTVPPPASAQSTAFTYQGQLNAGGSPASGSFDLTFTLYATSNSVPVVAGPITTLAVGVTNGLFTTTVDFGPGVFAANSNWLALGVRTNGGSTFTTLAPRQRLTSAPYAVYAAGAATAATATTATTAGTATSVPAANVTGTLADARLSGNVALRAGGNAFTGNQSFTSGAVGIGTTSTNYRVSLGGDNLNTKLAVWDGGTNDMGFGVGAAQFRIHVPDPSNRFSFLNAPAGAEIMTLLGAGRLGLGINSPGADLHVLGSTAFNTALFESTDANGAWLRLKSDTTGGKDWDIISSGPGVVEGAGHLLFYDLAANAVRLDLAPSGRVGIGTTSPIADLHVLGTTSSFTAIFETAGAGGTWLRLINDSTGGRDWDLVSTGSANGEGAGNLLLHDNYVGAVRMILDTNGRVGIGTTSPATPLHVVGDITATGNVRVNTSNYAVSSAHNMRIVSGSVNYDGSFAFGDFVTINHLSTGIYVVNFQPPFSNTPIVTAVGLYNGSDTVTVQVAPLVNGGSSFTIATKANTILTDEDFNFIAIGPP